jgi:transposase
VRSLLAELGITAARGERELANLVAVLNDAELPDEMKAALRPLVQQIEQLSAQIAALEKRIVAAARQDPVMRLLTTIRGVGAITAHAVVTVVGDRRQFRSARDFAAWCGPIPREYSSAGKRREKEISRRGERRLRKLGGKHDHAHGAQPR